MSGNKVTRKPWYRRKWVWVVGIFLALIILSFRQFIYYGFLYRPDPIQVTRGLWRVLDPGKPVEPLKFEIVEEGTGAVVEPGDLILVSMWHWSPESNEIEQRDDDWWILVGFRTEKETPFHSINPRLVSAFVGLKEGGGIRFFEFPESPVRSIYVGEVHINPFGSYSRYANSKGGYSNSTSRLIYTPTSSGYTVVHIKKVFKGQLKYRTTHLYDDSWFHRCYNWFSCEYTNTPREALCDDALYEGVNADGQRATFQYGPVSTPGQVYELSCG
ncbi:MAG: hypothetical protein LBI87_00280, partial [Candidatus Accumulibacter sp.]|nr:hypothetical protein [Accumulibacter sp.]